MTESKFIFIEHGLMGFIFRIGESAYVTKHRTQFDVIGVISVYLSPAEMYINHDYKLYHGRCICLSNSSLFGLLEQLCKNIDGCADSSTKTLHLANTIGLLFHGVSVRNVDFLICHHNKYWLSLLVEI